MMFIDDLSIFYRLALGLISLISTITMIRVLNELLDDTVYKFKDHLGIPGLTIFLCFYWFEKPRH